MSDTPRFSVTVPAYNAAPTLVETIRSVQAQTFADWELVIVDDGSTDGTLALAEAFAAEDVRIRVISQENRGSGGAYNTAVKAARSDLLVMLSADDLLLPDHLAEFAAVVESNPEASIFSCDGFYEYEDGTRELSEMHLKWADSSTCSLTDLLATCFFDMGTVYRRAVFDAVGGFRENIYAEDYLFFLLALARGFRHRNVTRPLAVHRRSSMQKSADHLRMRNADLLAVREVITTGLLSPVESVAAERAVKRLKWNIRVRRTLRALLGPNISTRMIDGLRHRRSTARDRQ